MKRNPSLTIFVAGIHGVGKSTLCGELAPRVGAYHVTASSLIGKAKKLGASKAVPDIEDNQTLLVKEYEKLSARHPRVLLDGHFCLLDECNRVEPLEVGLFRDLGVKKIVVAHCAPQLIHDRIMARDESAHPLNILGIESFQQAELEHAEAVADRLSVPLLLVDTSELALAVDAVMDFVALGGRLIS